MNDDQFFEWWNGEELSKHNPYQKKSSLYWAWEGWQAALRELNKEAEKNGEEL
jgi:hypothetical protein